MRQINKIIVHCSASDLKSQDAKLIDKWHRERGFRKIGYHYFIRFDGIIEKGRFEYEIGAHCKGHNRDSIGICLAGLTLERFTQAQKESLRALLRELKARYPDASIHGHREFANKLCPVIPDSWFKEGV